MADDTTVTDNTDSGFEPEPVPDNIADTALDGLQPADESTDSEQVEDEPDETEQDQPDDAEEPAEEADDSGEPEEPETEQADESTEEPEAQQPEPTELAHQRFERSKQARTQLDYVQAERQKVRQYESDLANKINSGQLDDLEQIKENQRVIQANQYLDSVERTQMSILNEGQQALSEIPFFKSDTPVSKAAFNSALQSFRDAYGVYDDETGALISVEDRKGNPVSLYSFLENEAARIEDAVANTRRETRKAETKMRARVTTPSNPGKVSSSGDELTDLLDKIGDVPLN